MVQKGCKDGICGGSCFGGVLGSRPHAERPQLPTLCPVSPFWGKLSVWGCFTLCHLLHPGAMGKAMDPGACGQAWFPHPMLTCRNRCKLKEHSGLIGCEQCRRAVLGTTMERELPGLRRVTCGICGGMWHSWGPCQNTAKNEGTSGREVSGQESFQQRLLLRNPLQLQKIFSELY